MIWRLGLRGDIPAMFRVAIVSHHLISYARECVQDKVQSSNYSSRALGS